MSAKKQSYPWESGGCLLYSQMFSLDNEEITYYFSSYFLSLIFPSHTQTHTQTHILSRSCQSNTNIPCAIMHRNKNLSGYIICSLSLSFSLRLWTPINSKTHNSLWPHVMPYWVPNSQKEREAAGRERQGAERTLNCLKAIERKKKSL